MAAVDICNSAIIRLRGNVLNSLDDSSKEAKTCKSLYDITRREVLRSHAWNFAIARASLAKDADAPLFEFSNKFVLPNDCLRVLYTDAQIDKKGNGFGLPFSGNSYNFARPDAYKIEGNYLLTNSDNAKICYIQDVEATGLFDSVFEEALALKLAVALCVAISGDLQLKQQLMNNYIDILQKAQQSNSQEGLISRGRVSTWLTARG